MLRAAFSPPLATRGLAAGVRATELARELGRLDLESAALDGTGSAIITLGHYGRLRDMLSRRLEIADQIEDPWEAGDTYAMAAWNGAMLGEFERSVRLGLLGRDRAEAQAAGIVDHCLNWAGTGLFHLGEWDRQLEIFHEVKVMMGDRAEDPPYFMLSLFGATAFVHEARGLPSARQLLDLLDRTPGTAIEAATMASHWVAWAVARRGESDRAWSLVHSRTVESQTFRPFHDQVVAELLALTERWDEVPDFLEGSRAYAAEAGLLALPVHLDRLEGRSAIASGRSQGGLALERARDGFARLGAAWERGRTELDLADAFAYIGRGAEARLLLDAAKPDLERAGALIELDRLRSLRDRLG